MKLTQDQIALVQSIRTQLRGCRFASFTYSPKSTGGKFRYTLLLGANYRNLVAKSLETLQGMGAIEGVSPEVFTVAKSELVASMTETKETGKNKRYTKAKTYARLGNGVKLNLNDFTFEIDGLVESKVELEPATKSRPAPVSDLAKAKAKLRKSLPSGRYTSFALDSGNFQSARVNGEVFEMA